MPRKKVTDENDDTKEIAISEKNEPDISGNFFTEANSADDLFTGAGSSDGHYSAERTSTAKRAAAKDGAVKTKLSPVKEKQTSFYDLDFNELDKDLSPDQLREWTAIYASFRSKSELTGTVIGVDSYRLKVSGGGSKEPVFKQVLCLVIMDFRVKILIPETEVWHEKDEQRPDYVIRSMIGAEVDYVITHVDRAGECALASRKMALNIMRNRFFADRRGHREGDILDCRVVAAGHKRLVVECQGFDFTMTQREISYAAIDDLRREFKAGQSVSARLKRIDAGKWDIAIYNG